MKFILFAHARSGSTSLANALNLHPQLNVAIEPFHPKYGLWHPEERSFIESISDQETLEIVLRELFTNYDGIKVLDYQLPEEIYNHMLLLPKYKVMLLRRRNLLQAVVSGLIAEQTAVWQASDMNADRQEIYNSLKPLSLEEIAKRLEYGVALRQHYAATLARRAADSHLVLEYEELYTTNLDKNRCVLSQVFKFLDLTMPAGIKFDWFLDPGASKINSTRVYSAIPNVDEIEQRFGSKESGWLFEELTK